MRSDFRLKKRLIIAGALLLIAADVALAAYSWNMGGLYAGGRELANRSTQLKISQEDINRAKAIQSRMPAIQADCDKFERMLFPATTGYSSVTSDLDSIAQKAGAQVQDLTFKQAEVPQRGLTAVEIASSVTGPYSAVVRFVNGLQRSEHVYILGGLSLSSDTQNLGAGSQIKITLHLQTYFRTAA
jgi:Tfp pilus assembly protein PilO